MMNASEARQLAYHNFDKIKNEKIDAVLEKVKESAENGLFEIYIEGTSLSKVEQRHIEALGFEIEHTHKDLDEPRQRGQMFVYRLSDLIISW